MNRQELLQQVNDYAERLIAAGDIASFAEVFGTRDTQADFSYLSDGELQYIYENYIQEED